MAVWGQLPSAETMALAEEDFARAQLYRLLARLLARPASAEDLSLLAGMNGDETDLGRQVAALASIAERVRPEDIPHEYHDLFIGLGRGELVPFGSYYLTGFLHEKPLARLRQEMAALGIERDPDVKEPEDHIAALMDMMAGLILGEFGEPASLETQRRFFHGQIGSWAKHFFRDLEGARSSILYSAVGGVGRVFMDIEEVAFSME
jgi:TorA maturation chaperone TorD